MDKGTLAAATSIRNLAHARKRMEDRSKLPIDGMRESDILFAAVEGIIEGHRTATRPPSFIAGVVIRVAIVVFAMLIGFQLV